MVDVAIILAVFFGLTATIVTPLAVVLGFPLTAWLARGWLAVRQREVQLQGMEVAMRLRESRMLPAWVDDNDPVSLLAWAQTDAELARLSTAAMPPTT